MAGEDAGEAMQVIGAVDLSGYVKADDLTAKVQPASEFLHLVKREFEPESEHRPRHPSMLLPQMRGLQFRPGEVTVWAGYNGHRKSMITSQVALDLCVQRQRVLVASLEMAPARTMARMSRQASAVLKPADATLEAFHKWSDGRLWLFDHVGRIDGEMCLALCRYFAAEKKGQHVFIDSMMMVCSSEEHLDEQKQFVTHLCRAAVETGLHLHLVAHCRKPSSGDDSESPTKYDVKGTGSISDQASNVVMVWSDRQKSAMQQAGQAVDQTKPDALATVEKQRNGAWEGRVRLWFHGDSLRFTGDRATPAPYQLNEANTWRE
jgi:twinkle protein